MKKPLSIRYLAFLALFSFACDPDGDAGEAGDTAGDETGDDTASSDTGTPSDPPVDDDDDDDTDPTEPGTTSGTGDETGCSFLDCTGDDTMGGAPGCDLWEQDCPEGEKCMPWANDGGNAWNSSRCTPLEDNPGQPGDSCTVEGSGTSGFDSCELGSMCWDVNEKNQGTCISLCLGSPDAPFCDNVTEICRVSSGGFLPICLPGCNPLLGCPDGQGCYPVEPGFHCVPDASGPTMGGYGDPCAFVNACDAGLFCAAAGAVPGCTDSEACCSDFCDLSEPDASAGCGGASEGQECLSAFGEQVPTPGLEDVGICAIPE